MVLTRGEILGPLSGLGRCFEIRDALTLEAHPTSYKPDWYHFENAGRRHMLHPLSLSPQILTQYANQLWQSLQVWKACKAAPIL